MFSNNYIIATLFSKQFVRIIRSIDMERIESKGLDERRVEDNVKCECKGQIIDAIIGIDDLWLKRELLRLETHRNHTNKENDATLSLQILKLQLKVSRLTRASTPTSPIKRSKTPLITR